ncbi:hypothetical protein OAH18_02080 [bacterium]|nr:hypothetical protein [bacterium]
MHTVDDDDPLLFQLERDFVRLLAKARDPLAMLKAEELLAATNDNTHWTNYSKATSVIRKSPDNAAIPLLLRYMVLHTKRSSRHIMIPEYARTITLVSGHKVDDSRPNDEKSVRKRVQKTVDEWWTAKSKRTESSPVGMTKAKLEVISRTLLEEVRRSSDYSGSGGGEDTAYRAYHNVLYRIPEGSSSEHTRINQTHPGMARYILQSSGYNDDGEPTSDPSDLFTYEAIPILAVFAKNGGREEVSAIANDARQNSSVRMICILALFRAGEPYRGDVMLRLLSDETNMQRRLIILCSLRWAGAKATDVLLKHMQDVNIEIATAAATAVTESRPKAALPIFRELLLKREHRQSPIMLLSALAEFESPEAVEILGQMMTEALEDKSKEKHLSRILSAYIDAAKVPRAQWARKDYDVRAAARLALAQYQEKTSAKQQKVREQTALLDSVRTQLRVASEIHSLRKTEYKRLLVLQGDKIVTAADTKTAYDAMKLAAHEVKQLKVKLQPLDAAVGE